MEDFATYTRKTKEFDRWMTYVFPTLEINAAIDKAFHSSKNMSLTQLMEREQKAIDALALFWSKLPTVQAQERLIERLVPWWREMRRVHRMIYELVVRDLREQGVDLTKGGTA
jgi:uncharacterized NAD(P)/FAD-binding protein YdhS